MKDAAKVEVKHRTHAADAQKVKAKSAFVEAQDAKKVAHAAQQKAHAGHEKIEEEKVRLEKLKNKPVQGQGGEHAADSQNAEVQRRQGKIDEMQVKAKALDGEAKRADAAFEQKRLAAIGEQDGVIKTQQAANTAARSAGQKEPFKKVNGLKDARDLASRSAKDQEKILGTRTAVTAAEAGKADARRVEAAAMEGPRRAPASCTGS